MARKGRAWGLGRRLRADERREIVERYRSGEPAREVAAAIGCSPRTVYQVEEDARLAERIVFDARPDLQAWHRLGDGRAEACGRRDRATVGLRSEGELGQVGKRVVGAEGGFPHHVLAVAAAERHDGEEFRPDPTRLVVQQDVVEQRPGEPSRCDRVLGRLRTSHSSPADDRWPWLLCGNPHPFSYRSPSRRY